MCVTGYMWMITVRLLTLFCIKGSRVRSIISAVETRTNVEITDIILRETGKPKSFIKHIKDRLGHDRRYSIDSSKLTFSRFCIKIQL